MKNTLLFLFVMLLALAPLHAQEEASAPTPQEVEHETEHSATNKDMVPATPAEASSSGSEAASSETTPNPTPETTSSIMPTDPSMVPPPEAATSPAENNTSGSVANDEEQTVVAPELPSTESIEKKKQEIKVRYYEVRTQVEKEEDVAALKAKAEQATTSEGKRQALRAYYELLFAKMKKVDPSLSKRCELMQGAYLRRLEQVSLQPTIPLAPSPTVEKSPINENSSPVSSKPSKKS